MKPAREILTDAYRLVLCAALGTATGLIAIGFRSSVAFIESLASSLVQFLTARHHLYAAQLLEVSCPALGGAIVGILVYALVKVHGGHGVPAVITAASRDQPMTDWRMGFKAATSIITIGSGGSAGPEGPTVELGAVAGSFFWKIFRLPGTWVRIMMGCGAAAGIAAIFNVPLGGVIFVLDVVMRDHSPKIMLPLMVASMAASTVNQYVGTPAIILPDYQVSGNEMLWAPVLGLCAGVASTLFIRSNFLAADIFAKVKLPAWVRPALGGACVGLLGLISVHATGEGYGAIQTMITSGLSNSAPILLLLGVILARTLATACTLGSGGTGGAFAPALVVGCALALAISSAIGSLAPAFGVNPAAFALTGMGGLIAGVFHAPLSGLVIAFNLSRWNSQLLLPIMCVAVISAWSSEHFSRASIYELRLLRDGVDLAASRSLQSILAGLGLHDVMRPNVEVIPRTATLGQVIDRVCTTDQSIFPVVDSTQSVIGMIRLHELRTVLRETQAQNSLIAEDLMRSIDHYVTPNDSLARTWAILLDSPDDDVLVLDEQFDAKGRRVAGLVRRADVVRRIKW